MGKLWAVGEATVSCSDLCPFQKDFSVVFIFGDGKNVKVLGYFGHPIIYVPHLHYKKFHLSTVPHLWSSSTPLHMLAAAQPRGGADGSSRYTEP
jgi:hypothetical protein